MTVIELLGRFETEHLTVGNFDQYLKNETEEFKQIFLKTDILEQLMHE